MRKEGRRRAPDHRPYIRSLDAGPHAGTPDARSHGQRWSCRSGAPSNARPCALASAFAETQGSSPADFPLPWTLSSSQSGGERTGDRGESWRWPRDGSGGGGRGATPEGGTPPPPQAAPPSALMIQRERAAVPPAALRNRNGECWKDGPPRTSAHTPRRPNGAAAGEVCVPRRVLASTQKICSFWTVVVREQDRNRAPQGGGGEAGQSCPGRSTRAAERLSVRQRVLAWQPPSPRTRRGQRPRPKGAVVAF